jgi:site-specific DNA-methyltransferase (adenine-specific)
MGRQDYHWQHEPILYGWAPGKHRWFSDRKQTTVLYFDRPTRSTEHPTMKPIKLFRYLIHNSTQKGELVLDAFAGSGVSLIAAEKSDRVCYCMELDPKYCDVIIDRWCQVTGEREVKINGELSTWQFIAERNKEIMH